MAFSYFYQAHHVIVKFTVEIHMSDANSSMHPKLRWKFLKQNQSKSSLGVVSIAECLS